MYKFILPFRYLIKKRITLIAVLAVALCVFVVIVVMTVLSTLTSDIKSKYHSFIGDCVVGSKSLVGFVYYEQFLDRLDKAEFVQAASPVIKSPVLVNVRSHTGRVYSNWMGQLMGVDPVKHDRVTGFGQWLKYNRQNVAEVFTSAHKPNLPGCVSVHLVPGGSSDENIGDTLPKLTFDISALPLTGKGALARTGLGLVNTRSFYVTDKAPVGLWRFDRDIIYVSFEEAQALCGMDIGPKRVNEVRIKFEPGVDLQLGCEKVAGLWEDFMKKTTGREQSDLLAQVRVQGWKSYQRDVISALDTERIMLLFIFTLIGFIAVFIVFVVVYMVVSHKSKDIGILKSVGVSSGNVAVVFLGFGFIVGVFGSGIGALGGWQFLVHINSIEAWLFEHFKFRLWDQLVYPIGEIPNQIEMKLLSGIIAAGVAACLIGALVPSIQAARRRPIETLQVSQL
jgi:lipoprotein-releasing system permease protein